MAAYNEFDIKRTAFAKLTFPTSNSTIVSSGSGVFIPKGAIITGGKIMAGTACTLTALGNCTCNIYVSNQILGSNDIVASVVAVETVPKSLHFVNTDNILRVAADGEIILYVGSGTSTTGGLVGAIDVYIDYIYCDARGDK